MMKNIDIYINEAFKIRDNNKFTTFEDKLEKIIKFDSDNILNVPAEVFNNLSVMLDDCGIDEDLFDDSCKEKCRNAINEMFEFGVVYEWLYGTRYNSQKAKWIDELFDMCRKQHIEFEDFLYDYDNRFSIEYHKSTSYIIFTFGSPKYSRMYVSKIYEHNDNAKYQHIHKRSI